MLMFNSKIKTYCVANVCKCWGVILFDIYTFMSAVNDSGSYGVLE